LQIFNYVKIEVWDLSENLNLSVPTNKSGYKAFVFAKTDYSKRMVELVLGKRLMINEGLAIRQDQRQTNDFKGLNKKKGLRT
jgi:hypothetical protein